MKKRGVNKNRLKKYFQDAGRGAVLIAKISPRLTIIILISYVIQALLPLLSLLILKRCLDSIIPLDYANYNDALIYFGLFIFTNICTVVANQFSSYQQTIHQHVVSEYFAKQVLDKAIKFNIEEYENPELYNELHLVHQQTIYKPAMFLSVYQGLIQSSITILLLSGFLLTVHWLFPVILLLVSIPLAINKLLHGYRQYVQDKTNIPFERRANDLYSYLTTEPYAKEVRIFNYGTEFINRFLKLRENIFQQRRRLNLRFISRSIFIQVLEAILIGVAYFVLINNTVSGAITVGGLVIYIQMFQRFQSSINSLFQSGIALFQHHLYLRNVIHYINKDVEAVTANQSATPESWQSLEVKNLSFTYPDTDKQILSDVDFKIKSGQIVAIVGENGSGKSTLVKLISRLYEPDKEMIFLDGHDVSEYSKDDWWKKSSILLQDYGKYYLSVEDNIKLAADKNDDRFDITTAVTDVDAIADKLQEGYKTQLGRNYKNGAQLSEGQWQKLAIARALYKKSNLLILDEPTSSLDPVSEYKLINEIRREVDNKMVILVTHKLYNLKMVDRIFVMHEGKIIEQGTFEELTVSNGTFFSNYQKQMA